MAEGFAATIVERCRWARSHSEGHPSSSWPAGEQVATALVLRDKDHLAAMGYTTEQAAERVCEEAQLSAFALTGWLNDVRDELDKGSQG
ncbi:hypothetical protein DFQ14_113148 [Halopolyspora algeriensis]|uniref:Uncharacterized protein n=1 Tax=Halopolyspora algeriensis TaxID=1500506 RepID=A0A368VM14_9ACTN|nr:hypothetical protein [Halopolyspora algeriensis]RCW40065.1 hypothetical protein DFQ14_113148 [Halopolyspora algeriensis]TQM56786.1 hypothetical protein FHU43_1600 [Halopolyspora algeriensis]